MSNNTDALFGLSRFVERMAAHTALSATEIEALLRLQFQSVSIIREEPIDRLVPTESIVIVSSGIVSQRRLLSDSGHQIVGLSIAGDVANLGSALIGQTNIELYGHPGSTIAAIKCADLIETGTQHPNIMKALWRESAADTRKAQEWIANIGVRRANARLAHFFLELADRFRQIYPNDGDQYFLPLTQKHLAETVGLSLVHTNKSCQSLKRAGFLTIDRQMVRIVDGDALRTLSGYENNHLCQAEQHTREAA